MNIDKLSELFTYEDGQLVRKVTVHYNAKSGDVAGTVDKSTGYVRVNFDGKVHHVHRLVWALVTGSAPAGMIDHIDGNRANNRIENLRQADNSLNMQNVKAARKDSKTQVLGASLCKETGRFVARIRKAGGAYLNLGRHETAEQAGLAYLAAKRELHAGCTI
jgi:hypothetical protein